MPELLLQVDPADLIIGANIRTATCTDSHADAKQFAASIKARGVLEAITCHRDPDDRLVVLRGQRRAIVAASVGTPTGTVPVRVVDTPAEVDRITDQLGENVHRESMTDTEVCDAVEQLALLGVSAAQITKRVAIPRAHVDAALTVTKAREARERLQQGLSLEDALLYAEFEADPDATAMLEHATSEGHPLAHVAQRLRDNTEERTMIRAEINKLRGEGLPVLEPAEVPVSLWRHRLDDLVRADTGQPVAESEVADLPTAGVVVDVNWADEEAKEGGEPADQHEVSPSGDAQPGTPGRLQVVSEWIVRDPEAAGLVPSWQWRQQHRTPESEGNADPTNADAEAEREAKRAERRTVIANNKAWDSAETVRRDWLATFCTRKTPPEGAEEVITAAILLADYNLSRAMTGNHQLLRTWLGLEPRTWQAPDQLPDYLSEVRTPKRQLMLSLAAVLAAWEEGLSRESWRRPDRWNARVLTAITSWGYPASPVESLMITTEDSAPTADNTAETGAVDTA